MKDRDSQKIYESYINELNMQDVSRGAGQAYQAVSSGVGKVAGAAKSFIDAPIFKQARAATQPALNAMSKAYIPKVVSDIGAAKDAYQQKGDELTVEPLIIKHILGKNGMLMEPDNEPRFIYKDPIEASMMVGTKGGIGTERIDDLNDAANMVDTLKLHPQMYTYLVSHLTQSSKINLSDPNHEGGKGMWATSGYTYNITKAAGGVPQRDPGLLKLLSVISMQPTGQPFTIHEFLLNNDRNYSEASAAHDTPQMDTIIQNTWDSMKPTGWTANIADIVENRLHDEIVQSLFSQGDKHILAGFTGQFNDTSQLLKVANGVWSTDYVILKQSAREKADINVSKFLQQIKISGIATPVPLPPNQSQGFMEAIIRSNPAIGSDARLKASGKVSGSIFEMPDSDIHYDFTESTGAVVVTVKDV